jgi:hypothetical protein
MSELKKQLARALLEVFAGREDVVAERWSFTERDGTTRAGYRPICANRYVAGRCPKVEDRKAPCRKCDAKAPVGLNMELALRHVQGEIILGAYPLAADGTCRWIAADFDNHDGMRDPHREVLAHAAALGQWGINPAILRSKSGKGYHSYVLFSEPVPAWKARAVMNAALSKAGISRGEGSFDRLFPAQDRLADPASPGNLIAMPFQGSAMASGHTLVLEPATNYTAPAADQIAALEAIRRVTEAELDALLAEHKITANLPAVKNATSLAIPGEATTEPATLETHDLEMIEARCAFMAHCRDNATTLSEPFWQEQAVICAHCADGRELFHLRSQAYSEYDPEETDRKFDHGRAYEPRSCRSIEQNLGFSGCANCSYHGGIRSPLDLGDPGEVAQAKLALILVQREMSTDFQAAFSKQALHAAMVLSLKNKGEFLQIRESLKQLRVPIQQWDSMLKEYTRSYIAMSCPYGVEDGCIIYQKLSSGGVFIVAITNFVTRITQEITNDDGVEQARAFRLEGNYKSGEQLPAVTISADAFDSMSWVTKHYGASAIIYPEAAFRLPAAIKTISDSITKQLIFGHTGWRQIEGNWGYLTGCGAITAEGFNTDVQVGLPAGIESFDLQARPGADDVEEAITASLRMLELAPAEIAIPIVAAIWRAPLGEGCPLDFSVFLEGRTGTRKSEVAALAQGHFGVGFHGKNLPGSWSSTDNALEKQAFLAKDAVFVVDDFNPVGTQADVNAFHRKADRILRGQGNQAGRLRMRSNVTLRPSYFPRGLIIATGEALPRGESLRARMLILEFGPSSVDLDVLTEMQNANVQGLLAKAMGAFIRWLAPQIDDLKEELPKRKVALRQLAVAAEKAHSRTPDIVASLMLGLELFATFAVEVGVLAQEEATNLKEKGLEAIMAAASKQGVLLTEQCPCARFLELLAGALAAGRCHIEALSGGAPASLAGACGWRSFPVPSAGGTSHELRPQGNRVGWTDGQGVYLLPDMAFSTVQGIGASQGASMPIGIRDLQKRLLDKGLVAAHEPGLATKRMSIGGARYRVLHLAASSLLGTIESPGNCAIPVPFPVGTLVPVLGAPVSATSTLPPTIELEDLAPEAKAFLAHLGEDIPF